MHHQASGLKHLLIVFSAVLWGSLLGFFGVFVSVFADGGLTERLITVAAILLIYAVSSGVWAYFSPSWSWHWSIPLSSPALLILLIYSGSEPALWGVFALYGILILAVTMLSAIAISQLKRAPKG